VAQLLVDDVRSDALPRSVDRFAAMILEAADELDRLG
jgi:hypothetical protein